MNIKITMTIFLRGIGGCLKLSILTLEKGTADYVSTTITTKQHHLLLSITRH